jgi:TonB family protein
MAANETAATEPDYVPVKLVRALETMIPGDLKHLMMEDPRVKFRVLVTPEGEILDSVAIEATHFGLLEKAQEKLKDARFEPALMDGQPAAGNIIVIITFYDLEQRLWKRGLAPPPQGGTVSDAVERRFYRMNPDAFHYKECQPSELDNPLQLVEARLCLVHPPDEAAQSGQVLVEYFIDYHGDVHLPKILESEGEYLSLSALETLQHTRFAPPTRDGKPALVKVRQPFNFD